MTRVVLDASAIVAVLRKEPGHEQVIPHLRGSLVSSVNLAEVFCVTQLRGSRPEIDQLIVSRMRIEHVPFDDAQARMVASIFSRTRGGTVGMADRACMALGLIHGLPVLTADHDWLAHDVGVEVRLFRKRAEG